MIVADIGRRTSPRRRPQPWRAAPVRRPAARLAPSAAPGAGRRRRRRQPGDASGPAASRARRGAAAAAPGRRRGGDGADRHVALDGPAGRRRRRPRPRLAGAQPGPVRGADERPAHRARDRVRHCRSFACCSPVAPGCARDVLRRSRRTGRATRRARPPLAPAADRRASSRCWAVRAPVLRPSRVAGRYPAGFDAPSRSSSRRARSSPVCRPPTTSATARSLPT